MSEFAGKPWIDEQVVKTPEHGVGRYTMSLSILDFSTKVVEGLASNPAVAFRFPIGHSIDSEFVAGAVTLATTTTPSPETVGSLRFSLEIGSRVLAPSALADPDAAFAPITKAGPPQIQKSSDAYTGKTIILESVGAPVGYLEPIYLRVDVFTPDPASIFQLWQNVLFCTVTAVFEEMWVRRELEVRAAANDFNAFQNTQRTR